MVIHAVITLYIFHMTGTKISNNITCLEETHIANQIPSWQCFKILSKMMTAITESNHFKGGRNIDIWSITIMPSSYNRTSLKMINHRLPWSFWCSCLLLKMTLPLKSNFRLHGHPWGESVPPKSSKNSLLFITWLSLCHLPKPTFTIHKLQQYQRTLCLGLALKEKQTNKQK